MKNIKHISLRLLLTVLIAAMALSSLSCGRTPTGDGEPKAFLLETYLEDGTLDYKGELTSSKATVGEALVEAGLLEGEEGPYGLYVKKVNGKFAEFESTGTYWAFYIGNEYAMSGVDTTLIEDGQLYVLRIEK